MKAEEEQDNYHEKDKNESPTKKYDHQINNFLRYISNHTIEYFDKEKSDKNIDVKRFCGMFCIYSNFYESSLWIACASSIIRIMR